MQTYDKLFIGGEWAKPAGSATIDVISPHTEEKVGSVPEATTADVDRAVAAARAAFDDGEWPRRSPEERIAAVQKFCDVYAARMMEMAEIITVEMGSPISFSQLGAIAGAVDDAQHLHQRGDAVSRGRRRATGVLGTDVIVRSEPVGVVAAIVPWNVPQFVTMSKLAPALLAGCTIVIKPAPETPLDAMFMAELLEEAGIPKGVVSVLPAGREVGEHLVRHPGVDKVAFTGSTAAGRRIAAICGEQLKRVSLELGGKSAAIILDDADLEATMNGLEVRVVHEQRPGVRGADAHPREPQELRQRGRGASASSRTRCRWVTRWRPPPRSARSWPSASRSGCEKYIALGQEEGAQIVVGGSEMPQGIDRGWYVQPTVFANVSNDMRIAREEIFGPVVAVIPFDDVDDAVRIANDSDYGLAGSVWTADTDAGFDIARRVRTGTYGINQYTMDFVAPFGGYKASGIGREFGKEGLEHYTELKSIVAPGGGVAAAG